MGEKEIMDKRTDRFRRTKRRKFSFIDILIISIAFLIFGGAIYYFFIVRNNLKQSVEPVKGGNDKNYKSVLKSKSIKKGGNKSELKYGGSNNQNKTDSLPNNFVNDTVKDKKSEGHTEESNSTKLKAKGENLSSLGTGGSEVPLNHVDKDINGPDNESDNEANNGSDNEVVNEDINSSKLIIESTPEMKIEVVNDESIKVQKKDEEDDKKEQPVNVIAPPNQTENDYFIFDYGEQLPPFFAEIETGDVQVIQEMINKKLVTNERSSNGFNALHYAATFMKVDIMKLFLDNKLFDATDKIEKEGNNFDGSTVLHLTCLAAKKYPERAVEAVELLVSHGALIAAENKNGHTPIFAAVAGNSMNLVEFFLSKGESIQSVATVFETSLLHFAMYPHQIIPVPTTPKVPCHRPMIKFLIEKGADINYVTLLNRQPIHEAAAAGCVDGLKELILTRNISKQARSPKRDQNRFHEDYEEYCLFDAAPLHFASNFNQLKAVEFLFLIQSDYYAKDENGKIARYYAETTCNYELEDYFIGRKNWEQTEIMMFGEIKSIENSIRRIDGSTKTSALQLYETYMNNYLHTRIK